MEETENVLIAKRRQKLADIRQAGEAFPNHFKQKDQLGTLLKCYQSHDDSALGHTPVAVSIAGRMMSKRQMGKASFAHIQDASGKIQLFIKQDNVSDQCYQQFKSWDIGDIVAVEGELFRTRVKELSVRVSKIILLTKSLRPLPEKFHGLSNTEIRYRQRYVDLMVNPAVRAVFQTRSAIIDYLRHYFNGIGFLEVETPMMHPIPGGANAKPFVTHHNALNRPLYLRIAPELYLKRLVIGGMERVYEINRNFRNEGLSTRHNPEFTMIEFYQAYTDYRDLMNITERLLRQLTQAILGQDQVDYQGERYDMGGTFCKMTLKEAILRFNEDLRPEQYNCLDTMRHFANTRGLMLKKDDQLGQIHTAIFEKTVEHQLRQPTFIIDYPVEVSPLARPHDDNPALVERFELFIGGLEIANGFSELNDPEEQARCFRQQLLAKDGGDDEAMCYDEDYITALEYGMPPTAGEGMGIDRLVMLLTDSPSIRDVLLFPQMRPSHAKVADK